jgi:hypothetical protein
MEGIGRGRLFIGALKNKYSTSPVFLAKTY